VEECWIETEGVSNRSVFSAKRGENRGGWLSYRVKKSKEVHLSPYCWGNGERGGY